LTRGVFAAVDCGTNSTRLLVADSDGKALQREMQITRLGEGVDRTRMLRPRAIDRTVSVLAEYRTLLDRWHADHIRVAATSAARDARNGAEFIARASEAIGVVPEVLGGLAEGRLSFAGATAELAAYGEDNAPCLVVDIGGGSTELIAGRPGSPTGLSVASLDVGCVRLTERHLHGDPPGEAEVAEARAGVRALVDEACAADPRLVVGERLIGLAGTVSTLAVMDLALSTYDRSLVHHHVMSSGTVEALLALLSASPVALRRRHQGLEPGRADVIVGGAVVLAELMAKFGFGEVLVSESDILEGLIASLTGPGGPARTADG
jgi:exopolyphosphatase / guanosine-5'-triphosphate,3'-diphosphate pyrophosphatase